LPELGGGTTAESFWLAAVAQLDHFCCAKIGTRTVLTEIPASQNDSKRGLIVPSPSSDNQSPVVKSS